ncbi:hypothetical protein [Lysinibacillus sp. NPDC086135]|uniref:hypothetical protein n=2 Tax=unclassified Lysinibacillus TaxID=2636778 RepID=UPI003812EC13
MSSTTTVFEKYGMVATLGFFSDQGIQRFMANLIMANLGYIHLGQSLDTFSGGELKKGKNGKNIGRSK